MENIEKCLAIAISELGKISFGGPLLIPAGKAMHALSLAVAEVERLKAEKQKEKSEEQDRQAEAKEEKPEEDQNEDQNGDS